MYLPTYLLLSINKKLLCCIAQVVEMLRTYYLVNKYYSPDVLKTLKTYYLGLVSGSIRSGQGQD